MNIRKLLFTSAAALALSVQAQTQSGVELFQRANSLRAQKNWAEAITYYKRAMASDANLKKDCTKWIAYCTKKMPYLSVSATEINIPYQGGDQQVNVSANQKWQVTGADNWCKTDVPNLKSFIVKCREANNSTREKVTSLTVKSGAIYKTLRIVQAARPEYIEASAKSLNFPAQGTTDSISVESNANWDVTSAPSWVKVEKKDSSIHIVVTPNNRVLERTDDIVIASPSQTVTIKIYQGAGDEKLTLSQNNLVLDAEGDVYEVKVYTDADNWFVGDYPTWMNVQKVGKDRIRIECSKNLPNGEPRYGSVQVKTDRQTAGVMVTQTPRMVQDLIFPNSKLVGGRNLSFGFTAGYYVPFIATSAGGDYVGSVVDYGLGTKDENASYKSASGYTFGVFADLRLYKNIFLTAGINFSQVKYKNTFNKTVTNYTQPLTAYEYLRGELMNSYTESYTHTMLEVPILASYRFKVTNTSHVQLNLGPVLNFGLSAKMKLSGNSDGDYLYRYNTFTNERSDAYTYVHHTAVSSEFNLYQPCVMWNETYTTENDANVAHHDEFQAAPLKRFNCGLRVGAAYEWAGLSFGVSYTYMLTNMANKNYWENDRFAVLNNSNVTMRGYKHRINTLEFKLSYTLRYLKRK